MALTWGGTPLKIVFGSFKPNISSPQLVEVALLPTAGNLSFVTSVLQQRGRARKRAKGQVYVTSIDDYNALLSDYQNGTGRTLAGLGVTSATYYIESLGDPLYKEPAMILFDIVFVEG